MKRRKEIPILLVASVIFSSLVYAENIKNYSNCEVCHGAIHYGAEEAKEILGLEGLKLVSKLKRRKTIKIDLDGVLRNGSEKDPDMGYEIKIWGNVVLFIKDLTDGSLIQIVTDHLNVGQRGAFDNWHPEIYLESGSSREISLDDSLEISWAKMKASNIYHWVVSDRQEIDWKILLKGKILQAIQLMVE